MKYSKYIGIFLWMMLAFSCTQPPKTIKVGLLNGPTAVSFAQMMDVDLEIDGQRIEFQLYDEPLHIQALMAQNKLDFAVLPTVMAANLYNKGIEYQAVGISVWGSLYVVEVLRCLGVENVKNVELLSCLGVENIEGERSRRVHIFGQASTADILFQKMMKDRNWEDVQIDYTYNSNMELANALLQHKIEAAVISEPLVSMLLAKDSSLIITEKITIEEQNKADNKNIFAQTTLLVNSRLSSHSINTVKAFSQLYQYSCNYANQQVEKTAEILVKQGLYTDEKIAQTSIPLCHIDFQYAADFREEIEEYLKIFYTFEPKSIGGQMPDKDFILDIR